MSESRDQPIDPRMAPGNGISLREFIVLELGALKQSVERGHEERGEIKGTLNQLVSETQRVAVALERAAGDGRMQDKVINDLVVIIDGNDHKPGLIQRLDDLERAQAKARNVGIGIAVGSGLGGTGFGAGLYAVAKKLGLLALSLSLLAAGAAAAT